MTFFIVVGKILEDLYYDFEHFFDTDTLRKLTVNLISGLSTIVAGVLLKIYYDLYWISYLKKWSVNSEHNIFLESYFFKEMNLFLRLRCKDDLIGAATTLNCYSFDPYEKEHYFLINEKNMKYNKKKDFEGIIYTDFMDLNTGENLDLKDIMCQNESSFILKVNLIETSTKKCSAIKVNLHFVMKSDFPKIFKEFNVDGSINDGSQDDDMEAINMTLLGDSDSVQSRNHCHEKNFFVSHFSFKGVRYATSDDFYNFKRCYFDMDRSAEGYCFIKNNGKILFQSLMNLSELVCDESHVIKKENSISKETALKLYDINLIRTKAKVFVCSIHGSNMDIELFNKNSEEINGEFGRMGCEFMKPNRGICHLRTIFFNSPEDRLEEENCLKSNLKKLEEKMKSDREDMKHVSTESERSNGKLKMNLSKLEEIYNEEKTFLTDRSKENKMGIELDRFLELGFMNGRELGGLSDISKMVISDFFPTNLDDSLKCEKNRNSRTKENLKIKAHSFLKKMDFFVNITDDDIEPGRYSHFLKKLLRRYDLYSSERKSLHDKKSKSKLEGIVEKDIIEEHLRSFFNDNKMLPEKKTKIRSETLEVKFSTVHGECSEDQKLNNKGMADNDKLSYLCSLIGQMQDDEDPKINSHGVVTYNRVNEIRKLKKYKKRFNNEDLFNRMLNRIDDVSEERLLKKMKETKKIVRVKEKRVYEIATITDEFIGRFDFDSEIKKNEGVSKERKIAISNCKHEELIENLIKKCAENNLHLNFPQMTTHDTKLNMENYFYLLGKTHKRPKEFTRSIKNKGLFYRVSGIKSKRVKNEILGLWYRILSKFDFKLCEIRLADFLESKMGAKYGQLLEMGLNRNKNSSDCRESRGYKDQNLNWKKKENEGKKQDNNEFLEKKSTVPISYNPSDCSEGNTDISSLGKNVNKGKIKLNKFALIDSLVSCGLNGNLNEMLFDLFNCLLNGNISKNLRKGYTKKFRRKANCSLKAKYSHLIDSTLNKTDVGIESSTNFEEVKSDVILKDGEIFRSNILNLNVEGIKESDGRMLKMSNERILSRNRRFQEKIDRMDF